jgi:FixJ family two-component response regulator
VDDNTSARNATTKLLQSHGFFVEAFVSAEHFLENGRLTETSCLLLDVQMPGMSGLDLQFQLALTTHHIPIVFVTGIADSAIREQALRAGAVAFLQKPLLEEHLLNALRSALHFRGISWTGGQSQ